MTAAGIEAMNVYGGGAFVDVEELSIHRELDTSRFSNLLMKEKTVAMPFEDPVSFGVNAAQPLVDALSSEEKDRIELLITCTESGIDFGKSLSTYIHHYLGLSKNCRMFEIKQACFSGTAGYQMALNFVLSRVSPGAKVLVVATDISRFLVEDGSDELSDDWRFAEPSAGAGAVALLVGESPFVLQADVGANGYYGFEVMDTCRPGPDTEAGNADLSLLSYLECCEQSYLEYQRRVTDAHYRDSFAYLAFHTPFGGMVKGAHRSIMRKLLRSKPDIIEADFEERVRPGLNYCQRVGNIMGATTFLALASTIDNGKFDHSRRVGIFSYGSGCCSEFYSGVVSTDAKRIQKTFDIENNLDRRYRLSMTEYDHLLHNNHIVRFGTRNVELDWSKVPGFFEAMAGSPPRLLLRRISEFHREYEWTN